MSVQLTRWLADEAATVALGAALGRACGEGAVIYLRGDLGAGKTTLCRGLLTALGHRGAVKSPTYTLVESYELPGIAAHHFDLYRLADPEELEFMGIRDYFAEHNLVLVEWPERGGNLLVPADIVVEFQTVSASRQVVLRALSARGDLILQQLDNKKTRNIS